MAVAEPPNDYGLWEEVKLKAPWPDTNEDKVMDLSKAWTASAGNFGTAAQTKADNAAWGDDGGSQYVTKTTEATSAASDSQQGMQMLATAADLFSNEVKQTKEAIADYVTRSALVYGGALSLPGGVDEAFRQDYIGKMADGVNTILKWAMDRVGLTTQELHDLQRDVHSAGRAFAAANISMRAKSAVKAAIAKNRAESLFHAIEGEIKAHLKGLGKVPSQINQALAGIRQRDLLDAQRKLGEARELATSRAAAFRGAVVPAGIFTKSLAGLNVASSVYDLAANPLGETGVRRGISVGMDVIGAAAGGTALAAAAGALTLTGVGIPIVAAGLAVSAAWTAGTYVYDHWDDITHGVGQAADWVGGLFK